MYIHVLSIFNFPRLDCFSVSPFPKSTSRFLAFLFPISLQLSSLSITHVAFSQFVASLCTRIIYTRWHIPSFLFFLTAPLLPFSNFTDSCRIFPTRCHLFHSCHVHQLSNSANLFLLVCFSTSRFPVFIVPVHGLRISVPSLITRHSLQNVVFLEFFFSSRVFSSWP